MYLDDVLIERILNIMFVAKDSERHKYDVKYNDISLMNLMFRFIASYNGDDVLKAIYNKFESYNRDYDIEFYICFILWKIFFFHQKKWWIFFVILTWIFLIVKIAMK